MKRLLIGVLFMAGGSVAPLMAQSDTMPPQLVGLSFAPSSVDVSLASQTVTFSLHITDNLSGAQFGRVTLSSPSGVQATAVTSFQPGILLDATFDVLVPIARFAESGPLDTAPVVIIRSDLFETWLRAYSASGNPGFFGLDETAGVFHVGAARAATPLRVLELRFVPT